MSGIQILGWICPEKNNSLCTLCFYAYFTLNRHYCAFKKSKAVQLQAQINSFLKNSSNFSNILSINQKCVEFSPKMSGILERGEVKFIPWVPWVLFLTALTTCSVIIWNVYYVKHGSKFALQMITLFCHLFSECVSMLMYLLPWAMDLQGRGGQMSNNNHHECIRAS